MMKKINIDKIKRAIYKNKLIVFLALLFFVVSVGGTIAHYFTKHQLTNDFTTANFSVSLTEEYPKDNWGTSENLTKAVQITNNGNSNLLLRVVYNETWIEDDEYVVSNIYDGEHTSTPEVVMTKNWNEDFVNDFEYSEDGWYYYTKVFTPGESVGLLDSVTSNWSVGDECYLDFHYEVVQADNNAAESVWGRKATIEGSNVIWD